MPFRRSARIAALTGILLAVGSSVAVYAATVGFVADFNGGDDHGFFFGAAVTVQSSGGAGGVGDGYLEVSRTTAGNLGTASASVDLTGDLVTDGVVGYSFWLNDVGTDEALEIHVGIGQAFTNFWISADGFSPPENGWAQFTVDLTDSSQWIQTIGTGTFEDALANTDRLLFRHDLAPIIHPPDQIAGDFGLDRITVLPSIPTASSWGLTIFVLLLLVAGTLMIAGRRRVFLHGAGPR